jgi:hypothetical protein
MASGMQAIRNVLIHQLSEEHTAHGSMISVLATFIAKENAAMVNITKKPTGSIIPPGSYTRKTPPPSSGAREILKRIGYKGRYAYLPQEAIANPTAISAVDED